MEQTVNFVVNALIFSVLGLVVMAIALVIFDKLTPYNLWQEIMERHNVAAAVVAGAMTLAVALIISSAIH